MTQHNDLNLVRDLSIQSVVCRRTLLKRAAAIGIMAPGITTLLAACGGDDDEDSTSSVDEGEPASSRTDRNDVGSPTSSAGDAVAGGTLTVGVQIEPAILDAQRIGNTQEMPVASQLYDSLLMYTPDIELVPHIADAFEIIDETTYQFHIRQGVMFHNGREMKAEDVQYSLMRAKDPDLEITRRLVEMIDTVEVNDPQTVTVTLTERTPLFPHWVSSIQTAIVPQEEIEARGDEFGRNPVGTGPFKFVSWESGSRITFEAFEDYFLGRPHIDEVIYRILPDLSVVTLELESGSINVAPFVSPQDFDRIDAAPDLESGTAPQLNYWLFGMNSAADTSVAKRLGVFNDKRVRQAFYHGVNWDEIALFGIENETFGFRSYFLHAEIVPWHEASVRSSWPEPQFDPDKARQLLADAGYGDGLDVEVLIWNKESERIAVPLQEALSDIGVNMTVQFYELATWLQFINPGDYDCYIARWTGQDSADPFPWLHLQFHSASFGPPGNQARFATPETDALLDEAESETDPTRRVERYIEAERALYEQIPQIPLFGTNAVSVWHKQVRGLRPDVMSSWSASILHLWHPPYSEVWIDPSV